MLLNGGRYDGVRILSEQAVAEMGRDQTRDLDFNPVPTFARGLGWDNVTHSGLAAVGVRGWHKKGGTMVYETDYVVAPDEGLAVLATFSKRTLQAGLAAEQILFDALVERGSIPTVPKALPDDPQPERRPTDEALAAVAGTYANKNGPIRVEVKAGAPRTLEISSLDLTGHAWEPFATALKLRDDGTFSSDKKPNESYRALRAGGRRYLLQNAPKWTGNYREEAPLAQYIPPAKPLEGVWKQRADREWLLVNEDARSWALERDALPRFRLDASDDYPGYLFATSLSLYGQIVDPSGSDTVARMFLKIPMEMGRDLNDVVIEARNGEEWVRYGSSVYRPRNGVAALLPGISTVTIGAEGYAEWRKVSAAGSVAIAGASAWKLYDKDLQRLESGWGDGLVQVAAPLSYLMLYGKAATPITLTVK